MVVFRLQIVFYTNFRRSQATANILLRWLSNSDHPVLHDSQNMRPVRRPSTAVENPSSNRSALCPILLTKPIALRIACTLHRLEQQTLYRRMESNSMRQTPHLTIRAIDFQVVCDVEQTIPIRSVQVRADVQIRISQLHLPYRSVEDQLAAIERLAAFVESFHIRLWRLQAWEFVVRVALFELFPIPWDVHAWCFREVFWSFVF
jgi:hypothetical protein